MPSFCEPTKPSTGSKNGSNTTTSPQSGFVEKDSPASLGFYNDFSGADSITIPQKNSGDQAPPFIEAKTAYGISLLYRSASIPAPGSQSGITDFSGQTYPAPRIRITKPATHPIAYKQPKESRFHKINQRRYRSFSRERRHQPYLTLSRAT